MTSSRSRTVVLKGLWTFPAGLLKPDRKKEKAKRNRKKKQKDIEWHNQICERARIEGIGLYQCSLCHFVFPRNMVAGDHIVTKGARPDLRHDVHNGRCVCKQCHTLRHSS